MPGPAVRVDDLQEATERIGPELTSDERRWLEAVVVRAEAGRIRVLIAGEAKRGKSSLINALLERDVAPTGLLPVTSVSVTVRSAPADGAENATVHLLDGTEVTVPVADLAEFVTETGNPGNAKGVRDVVVRVVSPLLAGDLVELVDTPGTGSVWEHNTRAARDAWADLDAVVLVVSADPPMTAAEQGILRDVDARAVRTFVVLNKIDRLDERQTRESVAFTRAACEQVLHHSVELYPCSATRPHDAGLQTFRESLYTYIANDALSDVTRAWARRLTACAAAVSDRSAVSLRALELAGSDDRGMVEQFSAVLQTVDRRSTELLTRCRAAGAQVLDQLNRAARDERRRLTSAALAEVQQPSSSPVSGHDDRARLTAFVEAAVMSWRGELTNSLRQEMIQLVDQVGNDVDRDMSEVRDAAEQLLGVTLQARVPRVELADPGRFWLALEEPVGLRVPLAGLASRRLPGRDVRARRRLARELPELVDRQIGRVRSDLQSRLRQTTDTIGAQALAQQRMTVGALRAAVNAGVVSSTQRDSDRRDEIARLEQSAACAAHAAAVGARGSSAA